jgi:hypothetical protein
MLTSVEMISLALPDRNSETHQPDSPRVGARLRPMDDKTRLHTAVRRWEECMRSERWWIDGTDTGTGRRGAWIGGTRERTRQLTRSRVDRFRLPFGIQEALDRLIITLRDQPCRLVLVRQLVPLHQRRHDAPDRVGPIAEMLPDRLGDLVQEHARGIEDAKTSDRGDVLRDDVLGLGAGMQKTLDISERVSVSGALGPDLGPLTPL